MNEEEGTLRVQRCAEGLRLLDISCGACDRCTTGLDYWCSNSQLEREGVVLAEIHGLLSEHTVMVLLGLSALAHRDAVAAPVLVETIDVNAAQRLAAMLLPVATLVTSDSRSPETRELLSQLSQTGRAATVLNVLDQGKAVRAVERGGTVVLTPTSTAPPALTEIVQRELTVIGVSSLQPLRKVGVERLSEALNGERAI